MGVGRSVVTVTSLLLATLLHNHKPHVIPPHPTLAVRHRLCGQYALLQDMQHQERQAVRRVLRPYRPEGTLCRHQDRHLQDLPQRDVRHLLRPQRPHVRFMQTRLRQGALQC